MAPPCDHVENRSLQVVFELRQRFNEGYVGSPIRLVVEQWQNGR